MNAAMHHQVESVNAAAGSARVWDRLQARLAPARLDRALASGAPPASNPALALRAERLVSPGARRDLARALERLAERSERRTLGSRLAPRAERLAEARDDLGRLARRLAAANRAEAEGVARARELLSDGSGPLFWRGSNEDLATRVRAAIAGLEPGSWTNELEARETR
jgi:hypothetical protein